MTDELTFSDAPESSRYELRRDGNLIAVMDYRANGDTVALTRAFTNPTLRGRGYAAVLTERTVDALEQDGKKIRPVCSYVVDWFEKNPSRSGLIA